LRPRRAQVHRELEPGRLLDRDRSGGRALEDLRDVASVTVTPVAANLSVAPIPLFTRSKSEWRIRGNSNAVGGTVHAYLVHKNSGSLPPTVTEIGTGVAVLADTTFDLRTSGPVPQGGDTVTVWVGNATIALVGIQIK